MSQANPAQLPGSPLTGANEAAYSNAIFAALYSSSSGPTAPTVGPGALGALVQGQVWLDTSLVPAVLKMYSGTFWSPVNSGPNRIINGNFVIDQPHEGGVVNVGSSLTFGPDMWHGYAGGAGTWSMQQLASSTADIAATGQTTYLRCKTTGAAAAGAGDFYILEQYIEGWNVSDLGFGQAGAQNVTLGLWVRSTLTGQFGGTLMNAAQNRAWPFTFTISASNTWQRVKATIVGDVTGSWNAFNTVGFKVFLDIGGGSSFLGTAGSWQSASLLGVVGDVKLIQTANATLDVTGVTLVAGSNDVAWDTVARPYPTELALCQRHYEKSYDNGVVPGTVVSGGAFLYFIAASAATLIAAGGTIQYKVQKRVVPTVTYYAPSSGHSGFITDAIHASVDIAPTLFQSGVNASSWYINPITANVSIDLVGHWVADARMV